MYPHFNFKVKHFWEHNGPWSKGTVRSVPELRSGDWEPAYPIPQAQCLSQEPAELHHREASRWSLWWPGLTQAAQRLPHLRGGPHRSSQEPAGLAGQVGVTSALGEGGWEWRWRLMHRNIPVLLDLQRNYTDTVTRAYRHTSTKWFSGCCDKMRGYKHTFWGALFHNGMLSEIHFSQTS